MSPYSISWDTTTSSNVSHTLTAVATDTSGNSKTSSGVSITVSNATDTTAPSVPTGLSVDTPTFNSLTVHWSASTDIDNAQNTLTYVLQRSTGVGNTTFSTIFTRPADAPAAAVNPIAYVDNTLAAGTTYNYKVQALDPSSNPSGFTATQTLATFAGPPAFVQSNASQSSSVTTGSCAFNSAQTVGHYNVVVISVTSAAPVTITGGVPTDQAGHVYTLLSGPTSIGTLTQWIFGSNI